MKNNFENNMKLDEAEISAQRFVELEKGKILEESNKIFKGILQYVEEEYREKSKKVHRYEQELFYLRTDFYKTEKRLKRANQTFEYALERIQECKQPQVKVLEDIKDVKAKIEIQEFHWREEIKRVDRMSDDRTDRRKLNEAARFFACKFYDEKKKKSSSFVKVLHKLFGLDRAMKTSLNNSINSMLSVVEDSEEQAMEILKSMQQGTEASPDQHNTSFFGRLLGRGQKRDVLVIGKTIIQEAQTKILSR